MQVFFLFALLAVAGQYANAQTTRPLCASSDLSYVIVMDSSSSVLTKDPDEWTFEKTFVKNFAAQIGLGTNSRVRIGLVNYGQQATIIANCDSTQTQNLASFNALVDGINRQEGGTAIHEGLIRVKEILSSNGCGRAGEIQVVLLLTDGTENVKSSNPARITTENEIRSQATIQAIAVGTGTSREDLLRLTGKASLLREYDSWSHLQSDNATMLWLQLANEVCEVGGRWAQWGAYGACSVQCGANGTQTRTRKCLNPLTSVEQSDCTNYPSAGSESKVCNLGYCNGTLSQWSEWGLCTETCQSNINTSPTQQRTRTCDGATGIGNCQGATLTETQNCNVAVACPGNWGAWGAYGACGATCQSNINVPPTQSRTRTCVGSTFGGVCPGSAVSSQNCNIQVPCPGVLASWAAYGACSATCQISLSSPTQARTRQCVGTTFGSNCLGAVLSESRDCNTEVSCPGVLSQWTAFGPCSENCQSNVNVNPTQTRTRTCTQFSFGGNCNGAPLTNTQNCNVNRGCNGVWSAWSAYNACSETCQSNINVSPFQRRTRTCSGATFGAGCDGSSSENQNCNVQVPCPGTLTAWGAYGTCSATCQIGISAPTQSRTRQCVGSTFGGNCLGAALSSSRDCNVEVACPGTLTQWGVFGTCSETCQSDVNKIPTQTRTRQCIETSFGGNCNGAPRTNTQNCNVNKGCPGNWRAWSAYGDCSQNCQSNINVSPFQTRTRVCNGNTFGATCPGVSTENQNCNFQVPCQGTLTAWSAYGTCSATCQIGLSAPKQSRTRQCVSATFGGNCNNGVVTESRDCNVEVMCPGLLSQWSEWSTCPLTCQSGATAPKQFRSRGCTDTSFGGNCNGVALSGERECVKNVPCPGILTEWSAYSACSATCQQELNKVPTKSRTRLCQTATLSGNCGGALLKETVECNKGVGCPGTIQQWGPWSDCSQTCHSDPEKPPAQSRIRFCVGSSFGHNCFNATMRQNRECNRAVICPVPAKWSEWSEYTTCSKTCGPGSKTRTRTCTPSLPSGFHCTGSANEAVTCEMTPCPKVCPINKKCECKTVTQYNTAPEITAFSISLTEIHNASNIMTYWTEDIQKQACNSCVISRLQTNVNTVTGHIAQVKGIKDRLTEIKKQLRKLINCNSQYLITTNLWTLYDWVWERCVMLDGVDIELKACKMRFDAALNSCKSYGWFHQFVTQMTRKF